MHHLHPRRNLTPTPHAQIDTRPIEGFKELIPPLTNRNTIAMENSDADCKDLEEQVPTVYCADVEDEYYLFASCFE
ncbi:unnamed protein product [Lathyrus oleraceus]